jgi:hypothetical protein
MVIREFSFAFNDLGIGTAELASFMGGPGELPDMFFDLMEDALAEAPSLIEIKGGYRFFSNVEVLRSERLIKIGGLELNVGKIVSSQLKKSTAAILFLFTAGPGISDLSKKLMADGSLMEGYVYDSLGSVTVEKAIDKMEEIVKAEFAAQGLGISNRYSPGYCNWDVAEQQKLFTLLPENFCGVRLTHSSLMKPIKSVSGIIGVGSDLKQKGYTCDWCNDQNCIYGKLKRRQS